MKTLFSILILACGLAAQDKLAPSIKKTLHVVNSTRFLVQNGTFKAPDYHIETVCYWDQDMHLVITPGRSEACWRGVVKAHNETMNDPKMHLQMDALLDQLALKLGREHVRCAK